MAIVNTKTCFFNVKLYWKFVSFIFYGIGTTIDEVVFYQFMIAQLPEKVKLKIHFGITIAL